MIMKKHITSLYLVVFTLLSHTVSFAQAPGDFGGDPGDANPLDAPAAPIGDYIWLLALAGLVFVFLRFKTLAKQGNAQIKE